jgi:hypothetical protein
VINSMHENGGTTAIDLGNGDFIVLNGVARSALSQGDFILSAGAEVVITGVADVQDKLLDFDLSMTRGDGMSAWEQPHTGLYLFA